MKYHYATDKGNKNGTGKAKKVFIAFFVILLIGVAGFLIYWFAIRDNSKPAFEVLSPNQNFASIEYEKKGDTIMLKATPKYNVEFYGWRYGENGQVFSTSLSTSVEFSKQDDTVVYYADFRSLSDSSFEYSFNEINDTAVITSYDKTVKNLILPSFVTNQWDFYTIVDYDLEFTDNSTLKSVVFSENINTIKANSFADIATLRSVRFGEGLVNIENKAFAGTALKSIVIPKSVSRIASDAFANCQNLQGIKVSQDNTTFSSDDSNIIKDIVTNKIVVASNSSIISDGITEIGDYAFSGRQISEISLPNSVKKIGKYAFENTPVVTADINHATVILEGAFKNCNLLIETVISTNSQMTEIGDEAFSGCSSLEKFIVPQSVKTIGNRAFENCINLIDFGFEQGTIVEQIGQFALKSCAISTFFLPGSVISLGEGVLFDCANLNSIEVASNNKMFDDKDSDLLVDLSSNSLLAYCSTSQMIPDGVVAIENFVMSNTAIEFIEIPKSVESIAENAFDECEKLNEVTIASGTIFKSINDENSQGCIILNAKTINVEASLIDDDKLISAYLDSDTFNRTKSQDGKYYVYTYKV